MTKKVILKPSREKSLLRRHPWVFSGAIQRVEGNPCPGDTVAVLSNKNQFLGKGAFSPLSQIAVRIWTFDPDVTVDSGFFISRLESAVTFRRTNPYLLHQSAYRVVHAESDGLPGLIIDQYNNTLVCEFLSAGVEHNKPLIIEAIQQVITNQGIFERSESDHRIKEGLSPKTGILSGSPSLQMEIMEKDCRFLVDIQHGHKTGFYLDQRFNREIVASYASERAVLNCFSYTGGFAVWALKNGASHVTNIDSSASALEILQENISRNALDSGKSEIIQDDVFRRLRLFRDSRKQFDMIILDPPKFAESQAQIEKASRGYKDINLLAFKLLRPGGILATFSCSEHIPIALFQKIIADAAIDAGREARIIRQLEQSADHPVALNFPEGRYLKGLICQV